MKQMDRENFRKEILVRTWMSMPLCDIQFRP